MAVLMTASIGATILRGDIMTAGALREVLKVEWMCVVHTFCLCQICLCHDLNNCMHSYHCTLLHVKADEASALLPLNALHAAGDNRQSCVHLCDNHTRTQCQTSHRGCYQ